MTTLTQHSGQASGRMMVLFAIFGAHVLLIYAVFNLETVMKVVLPPVLHTRIIEILVPPEPRKDIFPVQPTKPTWNFDPPELPDDIFRPDQPIRNPITTVDDAQTGPIGPVQPARVVVPLRYDAIRPARDFYPSRSQTLGEAGFTDIEACVGTNGQLDGAPVVRRSSGYPRLDGAAVQWAQQALRFHPATSDGVPMRSCKGFRVNFQLRDGG